MSILLYFPLALKLCLCSLYVDLKNNYISPGIRVHHGYFEESGTYRMFIGGSESIRTVKYGDEIVFPNAEFEAVEYTLYVEWFILRNSIVILYLQYKTGETESYDRKFFSITNGKVQENEKYQRAFLDKMIVRLSLDIDPEAPKHPFVREVVKEDGEDSVTTYDLFIRFGTYKFNLSNSPRYGIGNVHHSDRRVFVLFCKFNIFYPKAQNVKVVNSQDSMFVTVFNVYDFNFTDIIIHNKTFYNYAGGTHFLSYTDFKRAKRAAATLEKEGIDTSRGILDISEDISPIYFSYFKNTGSLSRMYYTLYQPKESSYKIDYLVDLRNKNVLIHEKRTNETIMYVEVVEDGTRLHILVNSRLRDGDDLEWTQDEMYSENRKYKKYLKLDVDECQQQKKLIETSYPIRINADLDEERITFIYQREVLDDDEFKFNYFYLNDSYNGQDLKAKYIFGSIIEVDPVDVGNIPCEKHRWRYRMIRNGLECREFLIRKPSGERPLDPSLYEIYRRVI